MYVENEMTTETDDLYQPLVQEALAFCDMIEGQALDARCCAHEPEALGRLALKVQDNFEVATSRLDIITGKLARDYGAAAGVSLWHLGRIGDIVFPIDGSPGVLEHGELKAWREQHGIKRQRFQDARHAYKRFPDVGEARRLGYRGMMDTIANERHEADKGNGSHESDKEDSKKRKGGRKKAKGPWTLRGDLVQTLERVVSNLATIIKRLPAAPDRKGEPAKNYPAIIEARALLKKAAELYPDVEAVLDAAEELSSDENRERADLIRGELRLHQVHRGENHAESEVPTVLPAEC